MVLLGKMEAPGDGTGSHGSCLKSSSSTGPASLSNSTLAASDTSTESLEQLYLRLFDAASAAQTSRTFQIREVRVRFRKYANANSRVRLQDARLTVDISDLLQSAPESVQESLASILISKLFSQDPGRRNLQHYRQHLNRPEVRRQLELIRQTRGRKRILAPEGKVYNLCSLFDELNREYFGGLMIRPKLGWTLRQSLSVLGHYDPSHHAIVLNSLLDTRDAPELVVRFVLFHEMLHLSFPVEHRGVRRCIHTPRFKEAEKQFKRYEEAQRSLKVFVSRARQYRRAR
jgi:predicted metal-dependent hydrolase